MIWHILDQQFCSFKTQLENEKKKFCKNEYNLTGTCSKFTCPLANGRYATVLEENGILYLHVKTIERAHTPANLWEKNRIAERNQWSAEGDKRELGILAEEVRE